MQTPWLLRSVFGKELRDLRRSLLGHAAGVVALVAVMTAMWPTVRDMQDIDQFLAEYPEVLRELFDIDAVTTGTGFMNAELFSIILPILFIAFAISRGARAIAGEEERGTLETLLVLPPTRGRVVAEKAAALVVGTTALAAVLVVSLAVASAVADMDMALGEIVAASAAVLLLGLAHGLVALAVGAATGRRGLGVAVAGVLALVGYVLYIASAIVDALEPFRLVSPFAQALGEGPLGGGPQATFGWLVVMAVVAGVAAILLFDRRDVQVP